MEFADYTFDHSFELSGAIVRQPIRFRNRKFNSDLHFRHTFFRSGPLDFTETVFCSSVHLSYAHAENVSIGFNQCLFRESLDADGIEAPLLMERCHFESDLSIRSAKTNLIVLKSCKVDGALDVADTVCRGFRAEYLHAATAHEIGPLDVGNVCEFAHAHFDKRVQFDVRADRLNLSGAKLMEGGRISVERGLVDLKQLSTGRPLRISGATTGTNRASIVALQDADAGFMTFAHVDMRRCVFYGSHDLGGVIIEPTVRLARAPLWYGKRRCVADEFAWRNHIGGYRSWGWNLVGTRPASAVGESPEDDEAIVLPTLEASQVATVYRALRSSFEKKADQPGAADFYYGEMEMRRHSREFGVSERAIVWLYWILSGYGLRASRAFFWLFVLIIGSTLRMPAIGFKEIEVTYLDGLIFSLRAVLPGLRSSEKLTTTGNLIEIGLTVLGPILFALAVLALRGRVKR